MKGKIIIYAVLAGLIIALGWILYVDRYLYEVNKYSKMLIFMGDIFIQSFIIYWAIRLTREEAGGEINFSKGLFTGVIVSVIIGTVRGTSLMVYYSNATDKVEHIKEYANNMIEESYVQRNKELDEYFEVHKELDTKEEKQADLKKEYETSHRLVQQEFSPSGALASGMQAAMITGFLVSLAASIIMMRKRK